MTCVRAEKECKGQVVVRSEQPDHLRDKRSAVRWVKSSASGEEKGTRVKVWRMVGRDEEGGVEGDEGVGRGGGGWQYVAMLGL